MKTLERLQKNCAFCSKSVVSDSILCHSCRCWMHKECSGIRGKLEEHSKIIYEICAIQRTDITEDCLDVKLNGQSLEIMEKFYCCGNTIWGRVQMAVTNIRSWYSKFRDLVTLLASNGLSNGAKLQSYTIWKWDLTPWKGRCDQTR